MQARRTPSGTRNDIARAVANLAWTMGVVVGGPLLLARAFGYPLPRQVPDWSQVVTTPISLVEPTVFINALVCIGWITWGLVVAYVVVDLTDIARGVGQRARRLGPASVVASKLVASIALLTALMRPQPATAEISRTFVAARITTPPVTSPILVEHAPNEMSPASATGTDLRSATSSSPLVPTYTVERGDSLWRIAEQQLGSGFRWQEIHDLNTATIDNPDLICAGWRLRLPADAVVSPGDDPVARAANDSIESVVPGPSEALPVPVPTEVFPPSEVPAKADLPAAQPLLTDGDPSVSTSTPPIIEPPATTADTARLSEPESSMTLGPTAPPTSSTLPLSMRVPQAEASRLRVDGLNRETVSDSVGFDRPADGGVDGVVLAAAASGLLAAGVVGAIDRRRRRVLQRRPVHAPLPPRDPRLRPVEAKLRAQAPREASEQIACIDTALRLLTRSHALAPIESQLLLVQATVDGVELLWDRPPVLSSEFVAIDDGHSWEFPYAHSESLHELSADLGGVAPFATALVTLGDTPDGPILVNLQAIDQIDVDGEERAVREWLSAVQVELATHQWAARVDVAINVLVELPTRISTSITIDEAGKAGPLVWHGDPPEQPAACHLSITGTVAQLRHAEFGLSLDVTPVGVDDDSFAAVTALLDGAAHDPYTDEPLSEAHAARSSPDVDGESTVSPRAASGGGLAPTGIGSSSHVVSRTVGLASEREAPTAGTLLLDDGEPTLQHHFTDGALLAVNVLGSVRTEGWQQTPKSRRTEDIVIYLAMARPDFVTRDRLIDALWNGKDVSTKLLYNYIGTLRKELGEPSALRACDGGYVLDECVSTDWEEFRRLTTAAEGRPWLERRSALSAALALVRGRPFDDTSRFGWAATDGTISRVEAAITDAASDLAGEALQNEDSATAVWAARRGLVACPWHLRLYGLILDAHTAVGDSDAFDHTVRQLSRAAGPEGVPIEIAERIGGTRMPAT